MIGIITDSTCDIPQALLDLHGILVVPQLVIWGNEQYRDRVDMHAGEFYRRLAVDPVRPHSSLPSRKDFQEVYEAAILRGCDELLVLTVSSAMSGTFDMAKSAAGECRARVTVIDSKGPTMSLGWQVLAAARAREAGATMEAMLASVDRVRAGLVQLVGMTSLEYLRQGGRIGEAARWAGTQLKVMPLVAINHEKGVVEPVSLARTKHALIDLLYSKFFDRLGGSDGLHVAVLHGDAPADAEALAARIREEHPPREILINMTGPVLGINTGPGALALCGYLDESAHPPGS